MTAPTPSENVHLTSYRDDFYPSSQNSDIKKALFLKN